MQRAIPHWFDQRRYILSTIFAAQGTVIWPCRPYGKRKLRIFDLVHCDFTTLLLIQHYFDFCPNISSFKPQNKSHRQDEFLHKIRLKLERTIWLSLLTIRHFRAVRMRNKNMHGHSAKKKRQSKVKLSDIRGLRAVHPWNRGQPTAM